MNSGMRIYEPLYGIEGVASSGSATVKVPTNRRHIMKKVFASATIDVAGTPTLTTDPTKIIDKVITMLGTKVIREEYVADIVAIRAFYKLPADASNALCLYYAEPWRSDVMDEVLSAWDTFGNLPGDFVLKFQLKAGLTNPSLRVVDAYDNAVLTSKDQKGNEQRVLQIVKRTFSTFNLGSVGDITSLPTDLPILGIYLKGEAGKTIDHVKVTVNDTQVIHDLDTDQNAAFLSDYNLDASQFSYPLRFDVEGQLSRRLEGIRSMSIRVTSSAAQTITAVIEQVAPGYI